MASCTQTAPLDTMAALAADLPALSPSPTLSSVRSAASSVFSAATMEHSTPATSAPISRTASRSCPSSSAATLAASLAPADATPCKPASLRKQPAGELVIETVAPRHYKAAAACLADAFAADPLHAYLLDCPDTARWSAARKWALHRRIFEFNVYLNCATGLVRGVRSQTSTASAATDVDAEAEPRYDAVAMWMPPGTDLRLTSARALQLYAATRWQLSREGRRRFFGELLPALHDKKTAVMGERDAKSWYLVYLGARRDAQGRGLGTRLVRDVTDRADEESQACYLESSNVCNVPLYERLGFETVDVVHCTRADELVSLDLMVREPVPKGEAA